MNTNKKIKTLEFKLSKILNWWLFWAYKSKFHGSGMEFAEHKEYVFWDNFRDIDWKAYNKTNTIYVKKYEEERDLNVLFVLDNSKSMQFGSQEKTKKEILEEIFFSLAMSAYLNNDSIWAFIFNEQGFDFVDHKKSKENIFRIFQNLDNKKNKPTFPPMTRGGVWIGGGVFKTEEILNLIYKRNIRNNLIFIMTDDTQIKNEKLLKIIWKENEIIFINIFDEFEINLTDVWSILSVSPWKDFLNIDLSDKDKLSSYHKIIEKKFMYLKDFFRKNNTWYINLNTKSDFFKEILLYFYKVNN